MMLPPPCGEFFPTLDDLVTAANKHARDQGYAIVKCRTKKRGDQVFKANLGCARGAPRKSEGQGKRRSQTIKCGCPFDAYALRKKESPGWALTVKNGEHNHGPSAPEDLVVHRRADMTKEVKDEIRKITEAGGKPSQIYSSLRSTAEAEGRRLIVSQRDIKNAKRLIRREAMQPSAAVDGSPVDFSTPPEDHTGGSTGGSRDLQLQLLEQRIATQEAQLREKDALLREKDAQLQIARLEAELSRRGTHGDDYRQCPPTYFNNP
ncbi:MAG: hypothetical protein Q9166_005518 [cf. Caloplaca sp. 2 TL-2023]